MGFTTTSEAAVVELLAATLEAEAAAVFEAVVEAEAEAAVVAVVDWKRALTMRAVERADKVMRCVAAAALMDSVDRRADLLNA